MKMTKKSLSRKPVLTLIMGVLITFISMACAYSADVESQVSKILNHPKISEAKFYGEKIHALETVRKFYEQKNYELMWTPALAKNLLKEINNAFYEGLRPEDYHEKSIKTILKRVKDAENNEEKSKYLSELDILCSDAFFTLGSSYAFGNFHINTNNFSWFRDSKNGDLFAHLIKAIENRSLDSSLQSLLPKNDSYKKLKKSLLQYIAFEENKTWVTVASGGKLVLGDKNPRIISLKKRLYAEGYLAQVPKKNTSTFDEATLEALKLYQKTNGLEIDGDLGAATIATLNVPIHKRICQIRANLDRMRAFTREMGDRYILVNIPQFELDVFENDRSVMNMKTIIGRKERKTPLLSNEILYLVLSPKWYVPKSIAVKDKLPEIQKDPSFLAQHGMQIFKGEGKEMTEVDPHSIDWNSVTPENFDYRIIQSPGADNALGTMKFLFPNQYSVYLHDTSERHLFKKNFRSFSSGCVRVDKPMDLALYVLKEDAKWNQQLIEETIAEGEQKFITLSKTLPVHIVYRTAWVDESGLTNFRNDLYSFDKEAEFFFCPPKK